MILPLTPSDAFQLDAQGQPRCVGCDVGLGDLEQRGHRRGCEVAERVLAAMPKPSRRRVVSEWPELREGLRDLDLASNLLACMEGELVRLEERVQQGRHASASHHAREAYADRVAITRGRVRAARHAVEDLGRMEERWRAVR